MPVSTTSIAPTCTVSFGSSNDTARLIAHQRDGTGDAMTRHSATWTLRGGLGSLRGADISPDGARMWIGGQPALSGSPPILRTSTDGGLTWTNQTACASQVSVRDILALSATDAISVGNRLCRTTDGGTTWTNVTIPGAGNLVGIDRASDGTMWAVSSTANGRVLRSTDGGVTWTNAPAWRADAIYDVEAIDANTAILVGNRIVGVTSEHLVWRTSDAGVTWAPVVVTSGPIGSAATSIDRSPTGTIMISSYSSAAGAWRSTDGGATWSGSSTGMLDVRWVSGTTWQGAYASTNVRRSTDDGLTWTTVPTGAAQATNVWASTPVVGGVMVFGGDSDTVFRSTDSGATYTEVTPPRSIYYSVAALGARRFVVVGAGGVVVRTADGGATLSSGTSGVATSLNDVVVAGQDRAVAVGHAGVVLTSDDGGATWQAGTSNTAVNLFDVDFAPETGILVAVGNAGVIRRSTDRGATWAAVTSPTASNLSEVAVSPDGTRIWVAGPTGGALWYSANSGASWVSRPTGETEAVVSLDASATGTLLATHASRPDYSSHTLRSTDGGVTWSEVYAAATTSYQVEFGSPGQAWVAVAGGLLVESTDGGATFSASVAGSMPSGSNLAAIAVADGNSAMVVGSGEMIASTDPDAQVPDVGDAGANLASGGSAFGVCVEGASGTATNPWPVVGTCVAATAGHWNPLPPLASDPGTTVATTATTATGAVDLRFGFRTASNQLAGTYRADVTFEVLAPG